MRIAYDNQIFTLQSYGGISRYFVRLVQGLLDLHQGAKVFAPLHRNRYIAALPLEAVYGREIADFPSKSTRLFSVFNQIMARNRIVKWQPEILHETYYSRFSASPNICPRVVTVHDMIHELYPNDFPFLDWTSKLKRIAVERADHVICVSNNTKNDLMRIYGTPSDKISVVHHGFDSFNNRHTTATESPNKNPFLLYVGNRGGYKNFDGFLKSVASSKKLTKDFEIVAFGGGGFSKAELDCIRVLGFTTNQIKQISGDDRLLGRYYSAAQAFVYPSLYEGFGIPPLEAMAHQCPVVSSNLSSMPEVIGAAAEFFNPSDKAEMRCAIEDVVYSPQRIADLREIGLARLSQFSWKKCTKETLGVYHTLLGKP